MSLVQEENRIEREVVDTALKPHRHFGAGIYESVYEPALNDLVILELKSVEKLEPVHSKQLLTYLRLTGLRLGLLINFGENLLKDGIHRIVNDL